MDTDWAIMVGLVLPGLGQARVVGSGGARHQAGTGWGRGCRRWGEMVHGQWSMDALILPYEFTFTLPHKDTTIPFIQNLS